MTSGQSTLLQCLCKSLPTRVEGYLVIVVPFLGYGFSKGGETTKYVGESEGREGISNFKI